MPSTKPVPSYYEIKVEGDLGTVWLSWFEGLSMRQEPAGENRKIVTVFYGPVPDQPALHGILTKIRDLNLTLVAVNRRPQPAIMTEE